VLSAHYQLINPIDTSSHWLGSTRDEQFDNIGLIVANNQIVFPTGLIGYSFFIQLSINGTSHALVDPTYTYSGCNGIVIANFVNSGLLSSNGGSSAGDYLASMLINITSNTATITLSGGTYPTASQTGDVFVLQINSNLDS